MTRRGKTTETRHFLPFSFFCVCARFLIFSFFAFLLLLSILEGMDDNGESTSKKKNEKKNYVQEGFEEGAGSTYRAQLYYIKRLPMFVFFFPTTIITTTTKTKTIKTTTNTFHSSKTYRPLLTTA